MATLLMQSCAASFPTFPSLTDLRHLVTQSSDFYLFQGASSIFQGRSVYLPDAFCLLFCVDQKSALRKWVSLKTAKEVLIAWWLMLLSKPMATRHSATQHSLQQWELWARKLRQESELSITTVYNDPWVVAQTEPYVKSSRMYSERHLHCAQHVHPAWTS